MKESVRLSNPYGECTSPYNLWYISRANVSALTTVEASRFLANFTTSSRNERERDAHRNLLASTVVRSEEHTSELQSRSDLVCRLLLEKKKTGTFSPPIDDSIVIDSRPHYRVALLSDFEHPRRLILDAWTGVEEEIDVISNPIVQRSCL